LAIYFLYIVRAQAWMACAKSRVRGSLRAQ
jgi:hypothetical protein